MALSSTQKSTGLRLMLIVVAALVLFAIVSYYNRMRSAGPKERFSDGFSMSASGGSGGGSGDDNVRPVISSSNLCGTSASFDHESSDPCREQMIKDRERVQNTQDTHDRIQPEELLPKDAANSKWAQVNPAGQGDVKDQNFLNAGFHIGVNTQGSTLRNASWDLRSEPPNPRYKVSIWQQSSIDGSAVANRRPLE
jgi:hypothetical protein